ncbi:MAG: PilZ domain-containing protein [Hyphomicrobiaceae bacterium]|nr:PilZ domain-containing protein [Hyphomicrobiaceae bacterium]
MPAPLLPEKAQRTTLSKLDRRRHQRVGVNLIGRFMLEDRREYPCQVIDMSPGGAGIIAPVTAMLGERVIAYIDHIGRIEGQVARLIKGGFAMTINAPVRKREKIAAQLTWLANRHELNLPEDRRHERITPRNPFTQLTMTDGRTYRCRIIDISLSGAGLAMEVKPAIGSPVTLGKVKGRVVRHLEEGVAVEFAALQTEEGLHADLA